MFGKCIIYLALSFCALISFWSTGLADEGVGGQAGAFQTALEGNPAFYDQLYDAEFLRPSGPRKSALRVFLKHEMEHLNRDERKAEIEAALAPKK